MTREKQYNPLKDTLLYLMMVGDLPKTEELYELFLIILVGENHIKDDDVKYFDFSVKYENESKDNVTIIPKNIITALWFCGFFPEKPEQVIKKGEYQLGNDVYSFSKTKKILTHKKLLR